LTAVADVSTRAAWAQIATCNSDIAGHWGSSHLLFRSRDRIVQSNAISGR
jgi:hypothetical protein